MSATSVILEITAAEAISVSHALRYAAEIAPDRQESDAFHQMIVRDTTIGEKIAEIIDAALRQPGVDHTTPAKDHGPQTIQPIPAHFPRRNPNDQ